MAARGTDSELLLDVDILWVPWDGGRNGSEIAGEQINNVSHGDHDVHTPEGRIKTHRKKPINQVRSLNLFAAHVQWWA